MESQPLLLDPVLQGEGSAREQDPQSPGLKHNEHQQQAKHSDRVVDILSNHDLAVERAQTWTGIARFGFNAMLESPEYKNKLRLKPEKMERIIYFLTAPDAKPREKDRADAQAKHQAQHWIYQDNVLYRKESRQHHMRRHLGADEVFDVLTAEHLKSGHHGRDKMLKVLETKYIGYTKDELMYVLDHCLLCTSKHIRGAAAKRRENQQPTGNNAPYLSEMTSTSVKVALNSAMGQKLHY